MAKISIDRVKSCQVNEQSRLSQTLSRLPIPLWLGNDLSRCIFVYSRRHRVCGLLQSPKCPQGGAPNNTPSLPPLPDSLVMLQLFILHTSMAENCCLSSPQVAVVQHDHPCLWPEPGARLPDPGHPSSLHQNLRVWPVHRWNRFQVLCQAILPPVG